MAGTPYNAADTPMVEPMCYNKPSAATKEAVERQYHIGMSASKSWSDDDTHQVIDTATAGGNYGGQP